jgi:hypothetical protein
VARPPNDLDFAPAVWVWVRGDVGVLAYDFDAAELGQLLASLRSAGSEPETPSSLSIGTGPVFGRLTDVQPAVDHQLSAQVGDQVGISMGSTDFDAYLRVLGPDGSLLVENDDAPSRSQNPTDSYVAFTVPTTGDYTVVASSYQYVYDSTPYGTGEYAVEVFFAPADQEAPRGQEQVETLEPFVRLVYQDRAFHYDDPACHLSSDGMRLEIQVGSAPFAYGVQAVIGDPLNDPQDLRPGGTVTVRSVRWNDGDFTYGPVLQGGWALLDEGALSGTFGLTWGRNDSERASGEFRCPGATSPQTSRSTEGSLADASHLFGTWRMSVPGASRPFQIRIYPTDDGLAGFSYWPCDASGCTEVVSVKATAVPGSVLEFFTVDGAITTNWHVEGTGDELLVSTVVESGSDTSRSKQRYQLYESWTD